LIAADAGAPEKMFRSLTKIFPVTDGYPSNTRFLCDTDTVQE
jgi:hypothetical protein